MTYLCLHRLSLTMWINLYLVVIVLLSVRSCAVYLDEPTDYSLDTPLYQSSACLQCLFTHKREYCEICRYEEFGGGFGDTNKRSGYYSVRKRGYYCLCCARSRLTNSGCCSICSSYAWDLNTIQQPSGFHINQNNLIKYLFIKNISSVFENRFNLYFHKHVYIYQYFEWL